MIVRYSSSGLRRRDAVESICSLCLKAARSQSYFDRRSFINTTSRSTSVASISAERLRTGYFLNNAFLKSSDETRRTAASSAVLESSKNSSSSNPPKAIPSTSNTDVLPPHRRRQKARQNAASSASSPASDTEMAPDMPSTLTTIASQLPAHSTKRLFSTLLALSKPRLSMLIVLTTTSAYSLYPVPTLLSPAITDTPSLSALTLLFLTVGTSLTCASANALNMLYEPKWDAMMSRTRNRPLVRGLISGRGAALFAIVAGGTGVIALYYGVNPTVAFLGGFNIFLYAGVYTPMKRISVVNTWVGAIVGGIPPLMGWAAAAGQTATGEGTWRDLLLGEQNLGGWLLASLLFAWQFPHFMALSWGIREEYKNAGYRMLAWTNSKMNGRVALRYSLLFMPICFALCYTGVTEWSFAIASTPVNLWILREAWKFWRLDGYKGSARSLFWASVWHLPVVMVLAMVEKKGMWQRAWQAAFGQPVLDDEEWLEEEDDAMIDGIVSKPIPQPIPQVIRSS